MGPLGYKQTFTEHKHGTYIESSIKPMGGMVNNILHLHTAFNLSSFGKFPLHKIFHTPTDHCFILKAFLKDLILMSTRLRPEILYFFLLNDEVGTWTLCIDF